MKLQDKKLLKWSIYGGIGLFLFGFLGHFIYQWTGELFLVGLFFPVNESIWEHIKLFFFPAFVLYLVQWFLLRYQYKNLLFAGTLALLIGSLWIPMQYYLLKYGFSVENVFFDILSLFIGILIAQSTIYFLGKKTVKKQKIWITVLLAAMLIVFLLCTVYPPHLPIFYDVTEGIYGMGK